MNTCNNCSSPMACRDVNYCSIESQTGVKPGMPSPAHVEWLDKHAHHKMPDKLSEEYREQLMKMDKEALRREMYGVFPPREPKLSDVLNEVRALSAKVDALTELMTPTMGGKSVIILKHELIDAIVRELKK